jgi:hypothetical protein
VRGFEVTVPEVELRKPGKEPKHPLQLTGTRVIKDIVKAETIFASKKVPQKTKKEVLRAVRRTCLKLINADLFPSILRSGHVFVGEKNPEEVYLFDNAAGIDMITRNCCSCP